MKDNYIQIILGLTFPKSRDNSKLLNLKKWEYRFNNIKCVDVNNNKSFL